MTKMQIAEMLIRNKGGGEENRNKFDARDFFAYIDVVLPGIIELAIAENGNEIDGSLLLTFENVPILWSDTRKICYMQLPCAIHNLAKDRGLQQIQPMTSEVDMSFVRTTSAAIPVYDLLEAGNWDGETDFYLEGDKVIFPKMRKAQAEAFLKVKVIPATSAYGENDPIRIPGKYEELLVQKVMALAEPQNRNMVKTTNDSNANSK